MSQNGELQKNLKHEYQNAISKTTEYLQNLIYLEIMFLMSHAGLATKQKPSNLPIIPWSSQMLPGQL